MNLSYRPKVKKVELTKIEVLILSALGEISNRLQDILVGCRRKYELEPTEFMKNHICLMWRAPEIYNLFYIKFGYFGRNELKNYVDKYIERMEISNAWESLEDIEALWDDFLNTVSTSLKLNETHEDNFIKYYFMNTKQLYDTKTQSYVDCSQIFNRLSVVILIPLYLPGTVLIKWMKQLGAVENELYVLGIDIKIVLFGNTKKAKLWMKQYKINYDNLYIDTTDNVLKARRNMCSIFSIKSMETIGLSTSEKIQFITPDEIDWSKHLFPGGLAFVSEDGKVLTDRLCEYLGQFPEKDSFIELACEAFGKGQNLSFEETQTYLKDGMKYYIVPNFTRMRYEVNSGFYYDPVSTLYYESKSGYFYDGNRGIYLYWDKESQCYLPVPSTGESASVCDSSIKEEGIIASKEAIIYEEEKSAQPEPSQDTVNKDVKKKEYLSIREQTEDDQNESEATPSKRLKEDSETVL